MDLARSALSPRLPAPVFAVLLPGPTDPPKPRFTTSGNGPFPRFAPPDMAPAASAGVDRRPAANLEERRAAAFRREW